MRDVLSVFDTQLEMAGNFLRQKSVDIDAENQAQTEGIFSDKWAKVDQMDSREALFETQRSWFLKLYGFDSEDSLARHLKNCEYILDAGCGLGYKAAWFAELAPESTVIGIDISEAAQIAAGRYSEVPNLYFTRGDIAATGLKTGSIDFVVCDQVIMHTEDPAATFSHLADVTAPGGEFACYVYSKKALPRELIDDHFRTSTHAIPNEAMWEFASQLTELGKRLSELNIEFDAPDIPVLGIKGGRYDIQRFIYWNFLKCFWKEEWGREMCDATNYDWYAPSNAKRYSRDEFESMIAENNLSTSFFHAEEACYSGRFAKRTNG